MSNISSYLTAEHRSCDQAFAEIEAGASQGDWTGAKQNFEKFSDELLLHLDKEEQVLFPSFENATGMTGGPTQMMRMEHEQMRGMLGQLASALEAQDLDAFAGASETMHMLIQQHNMKEEQMLYRMAEQHLSSEWESLRQEMESLGS